MRRWRDMTAGELTQMLCNLTPPLCRMLSDGAVQRALEEVLRGDIREMDVVPGWAAVAEKLLPLLLEKHRADVMAVSGALLGWTAEETSSRPACEVLGLLKQRWMAEMPAFLRLCRIWGEDAVLQAVSGAGHPGSPRALEARLRQMMRQELRQEAQTGLLWQLAAQAGCLRGMPGDMPEELRAPRPMGGGMSAEGVRQLLLRRLTEEKNGMEEDDA